jgi:hypothetical protein
MIIIFIITPVQKHKFIMIIILCRDFLSTPTGTSPSILLKLNTVLTNLFTTFHVYVFLSNMHFKPTKVMFAWLNQGMIFKHRTISRKKIHLHQKLSKYVFAHYQKISL